MNPQKKSQAKRRALPDDVAVAFETFKQCIAKHRALQWMEISQPEMVEALRSLAALTKLPH